MTFRSFSLPFCCVVPLVLSVAAVAQEEDLGSLVAKAHAAMTAQQWEDALALNTQAVERFGANNPLQAFGPQFGAIYFHKGTCEMKLKRWDEAMKSFEICYRDFPNPGPTAEGGNVFLKMALLKWGEAAMGAEKWELAISQFRKFINERDRTRDVFPQGPFHIGMAICQYRLGRIPEGNENLEIALKNKIGFPTPDSGIVAGLQSLVGTVIASRQEAALLDFIGKNRGELVIEPFAMHRFSNVYLKLAGDAIGADMPRAALALYQLVPSTDAAMDDIRARLKSMGSLETLKDGPNILVRKQLEADLADLENERRGRNSAEMVKLAGTALIHEKSGNTRGALAAYRQTERYYPSSEKREDNLANLVRTAALVSTGAETRRHAEEFEKSFPNSPQLPSVRRMMLTKLSSEGNHAACIEVAAPMLEKLAADTPEHDLCLHLLGVSWFHTGAFEKARPLLDQHVETYPKSVFALPAAYFRASNLTRLGQWNAAAGLLDAFLKDHPDTAKNPYLPFALCDRAACHQAENQPQHALENLGRVITGFPDCPVIDQAHNLIGRIEQSLGNAKNAEKAWLRAVETAEARGNRAIAGEALHSLIRLLAGQSRTKELVGHTDRFWKDHAKDSPYRTSVAIAQVRAFESSGRADDALRHLRESIAEVAANPAAGGLDELIHAYSAAYLQHHTADALRQHFHDFPGLAPEHHAVRAKLRMAVIEAFEKIAADTKDQAHQSATAATIRTLYQELKTDFPAKDLSNAILVKIGDHLRLATSTPREALPFYDEVIGREDPAQRFAALLGRADVFSASTTAADLEKSLADFTRVSAESKDMAERDHALKRIAELQTTLHQREAAGK
jgi:tetratricopeptide (TPR) repeat protein